MKTLSTRRYVSLAAVVTVLLVIHLYRPETTSLWFDAFFNWLHVPIFAFVSIGLFYALGEWRSNVNKAILAFGAALILAFLSEAAQIPTSRDASWSDIVSDVMGAAIGLFAIPTVSQRTRLKIVSRIIAILLLIISGLPLLGVTSAYIERNHIFPVIYDGEWPSRGEFMSLRGMAIDFRNLYPDWRGYESLKIDIAVLTDQPFQLDVRVHDKEHLQGSQPTSDRFDRQYRLDPGHNIIEIPLAEIAAAPTNRQLDMSHIDGLVLYSKIDEDRHRVHLRRIWLD